MYLFIYFFNSGDSSLWRFLLDLLLTPEHGSILQWTGNDNEFRIVDVATVAKLWERHKRPHNDGTKEQVDVGRFTDLLSNSCSSEEMDEVDRNTLTFKFAVNIEKYIREHKCVSM